MTSQHILIEGIGGIGGVVAGRLIQAGYDVTLVTANPQITEALNTHGLRLITPEGTTAIRAKAYTILADLPAGEHFDAVYLLMKANTVVEAAKQTVPLLTSDGYMVTFQNGIVEDAVATRVGGQRIISGVIGWGGTMRAPGIYEKTSPGATYLGELNGELSYRLGNLAKVMEQVTPVVATRHIRGVLWSKLAINCTITTLGALTGELLGDMLADRRMRQVFARTYAEVIDTADALGIKLQRIAANPRLLYVPPNAGLLTRFAKDLLVQFAGRRYGRVKPSMLQSLERGRPTEIDFLNGYVVEQAKIVNVPTPVNAALVKLIKAIEAGQRAIDPKNVDDLLRVI
jgi:2-dehydropantoate 2-reductase